MNADAIQLTIATHCGLARVALATAEERCEAFVRAIGKWKDEA